VDPVEGYFAEYLRKQSKKTARRRRGKAVFIVEQEVEKSSVPSELIDRLLLDSEGDVYIVEKGVAEGLIARIRSLEEENAKLRRINTILQVVVAVLLLLTILLWAFGR